MNPSAASRRIVTGMPGRIIDSTTAGFLTLK